MMPLLKVIFIFTDIVTVISVTRVICLIVYQVHVSIL